VSATATRDGAMPPLSAGLMWKGRTSFACTMCRTPAQRTRQRGRATQHCDSPHPSRRGSHSPTRCWRCCGRAAACCGWREPPRQRTRARSPCGSPRRGACRPPAARAAAAQSNAFREQTRPRAAEGRAGSRQSEHETARPETATQRQRTLSFCCSTSSWFLRSCAAGGSSACARSCWRFPVSSLIALLICV
jgi:hypothetical protein